MQRFKEHKATQATIKYGKIVLKVWCCCPWLVGKVGTYGFGSKVGKSLQAATWMGDCCCPGPVTSLTTLAILIPVVATVAIVKKVKK